jgi:hypothetical protein
MRAAFSGLQVVATLINNSFQLKEGRDRVVAIDERLRGLDKHLFEGFEGMNHSINRAGGTSLVHAVITLLALPTLSSLLTLLVLLAAKILLLILAL